MFEKLFAESGLSLDRLKTLLEVGVAGSIAKAAGGDPVRQSQYSRQLKELEDFFRTKLVERHGKGMRLTPGGRELARISRFFMLGLANFQRGCLAEEQTFKLGASATFIRQVLLPVLSPTRKPGSRYLTETVSDAEIERRLHDLTLDFGVVNHSLVSRPLQTKCLGSWKLTLWVPRKFGRKEADLRRQFQQQDLPLALARSELSPLGVTQLDEYPAQLVCDNFLEAREILARQELATVLPDYLAPGKEFIPVSVPALAKLTLHYYLVWNPRLLRLNPPAVRWRDALAEWLTKQFDL